MKRFTTAATAVFCGALVLAVPAARAQPPAGARGPDHGAARASEAGPAAAAGEANVERPVRPPKMPYGMPITLSQAKHVAAAAEAAAIQANVKVAIAITDNNGELVYFEQLDDTSTGIRDLAVQKARFAARYRMPTSYVAGMKRIGNDVFLAFPGAFPGAGGVTLTFDGRTIGGLGVSGGADGAVADAGAAALAALERASLSRSTSPEGHAEAPRPAPEPSPASAPGARSGSAAAVPQER
jgi:glc operon protein GlcG